MAASLPSLIFATSTQGPTTSTEVPFLAITAGVLLLLVATAAAHASAALVSCSPTRLKRLLGEGGTETLQLLTERNLELRVLARLLMIGAACGSLVTTSSAVSTAAGSWVFGALCVSMLFLVAVLPAIVAQRGAERVVLLALPALRPLRLVLAYPVIRPLIMVCRPILRALGIPDHTASDARLITDDILAAVSDSTGEDHLKDEERAWIGNIVALKERDVSEVMMPRTDIHALDASLPLAEGIRLAVEKGHSRFPVYQETIDNVVGVFYAKDVLSRLARAQDTSSILVGEVVREPMFAPESMLVGDLLREFRSSKVQMAIVLDEYGGTAGLITIEDILEEIVGEITDEFDPDEELQIRAIDGQHAIEVSGKTRVDEANIALGEVMIPPGEDYDTVGGFVFHHLGHLPEDGQVFQTDGMEFQVLEVAERRIRKLRLTVLSPQASD